MPEVPTEVQRYLSWWATECRTHRISPRWDPAAYRIVRKMLREYGPRHLRIISRYFLEHYGQALRDETIERPFICLAGRREELVFELKEKGLWPQ